MAGIYIHIPFCKKACHYCDFHFVVSQKNKDAVIDAIVNELEFQPDYLKGDLVNTIYFGGGTPSLLEEKHVKEILKSIRFDYNLSSNPEITFEANPDDLDFDKLQMLYDQGVNRLSIGIQTFHDPHLKWLNRAHSSQEAEACIQQARKVGFENISMDLIYALPSKDHSIWKDDLKRIVELQPEHLSSYCLTIEPKTAFGNWLSKGKIEEIDEDYAAEQFEILLEAADRYGYEQYEISNFAQPGYESLHNSNYWRHEKFLGVGPAAHSYDGKNRQANVSNNTKYLKSIERGELPFELIPLTKEDQVNEYILTSLRTKWGCDLDRLKSKYDVDLLESRQMYLTDLLNQGMIFIEDGFITLTNNGKLLADKIASDLFILDPKG
mgnify:CR=1 FL=1